MRRSSLALGVCALLVTSGGGAIPASADWPPDGVPLCGSCDSPGGPLVAPDGEGGAFVVWGDTWTGNYDVRAQRVTADGEIAAGWPAAIGAGLPVSTGPQPEFVNAIAPDGLGGLLIAWFDYREPPATTGIDIYAQRILHDGSLAPGWAVNGMPVCRAAGDQAWPVMIADGTGGAFISWTDQASLDIYLQRLTPAGVPAPGWPANGLPVCTDQSRQGSPQLVMGGLDAVLIAWGDHREGTLGAYAQRVLGDGSVAPGWPVNGSRIVASRGMSVLASDGADGGFAASATFTAFYDDDYYLHRFTSSGATALGWSEGGVPVCLAPDERVGLQMVADGTGGALLAWSDYREFPDDDIFAARFAPDGSLQPGWPAHGLAVTADTDALDDWVVLAPDGMGGAFMSWAKYKTATGDRVYVQHLTGVGAVPPGWPAGGRLIPTAGRATRPGIASDGRNGAIVAWSHGSPEPTVRALRFFGDGPTAVQVSLVQAEAESDRVRLAWWVAETGSFSATVERRSEPGAWQRLGTIAPDGTGRLQYEDRTVEAGTRYAYRLAYRDGADLAHSAETWVEVSAPRFALRAIAPNPSAGDALVSFSLASSDPATLEVYDVHGRQVQVQDLGTLGARSHQVRLGPAGRLPAGVYTVRLRQGTQMAAARAVVVR